MKNKENITKTKNTFFSIVKSDVVSICGIGSVRIGDKLTQVQVKLSISMSMASLQICLKAEKMMIYYRKDNNNHLIFATVEFL